MSNLWNLQFGGTAALPILTRGESKLTDSTTDIKDLTNLGIYGDQSSQVKDPINVVKDFAWTNSPKGSRDDVPKLQMIEQRIVLNSTVTNMVYSTLASVDNVAALGNTAAGLVDRFFPKENPEDATASGDAVDEATTTAEEVSNKSKLRDAFEAVMQGGYFKTFDSEVLKPYEGLYATEYTGFNYYFPYLEDAYREVNNNFGAGDDNNILGPLASLASDAAALTNVLNIAKPGTYIEKSKQFSMGDSGRTLNITIPLLNTGSFEDVRRNWQLIFGLVYQNRPGRVSKSIIDQPVIYEVHLPGVAYMPYAYISSLSVKFLGNRRDMEFDVPIMGEGDGGSASNIGSIRTVIPDAYELSLSITGMNEETRNFIYASVKKDKLTVNKPIAG
tara:strand:- start:1115 stop:2278 length:1164 start_codon:yes stop_codon:yes gene_type:complete